MKSTILAGCLFLFAHAALAETAPVVVTPVLSATTTASGQPIALPRDRPQVLVSQYEIAPGAKLPVHKHPFPRYAYVLSGTLTVTNVGTGVATEYRTGDFIVEIIDAWHFGQNAGPDLVRLLVIDQVEEGQSNTILREP